jgi:predicted porin
LKKILLASGILCGLAASSASAQSSVTLYGVVDSGLLYQSDPVTGSGSKVSLSGGGQGSSIFGMTGTEDLGGRLHAFFQIEGSFNSASGVSTLGGEFGRVSRVGLFSEQYGTLSAGLQYTPLYSQALLPGDAFDQFMVGYVGELFSAYARYSNSVLYVSPDMYGFTTSFMYSFGNVAGDFAASRTYGGSISYKHGPLRLNAAYHSANDATGFINTRATSLTGNYDFGPVNVFSETQFIRSDLNGIPGTTKTGTNANAYSLGVRIPVSVHRAVAQISYLTDERKVAHSDGHALFLSAGFYYLLSKSTNLYASVGHVFNNGTTQFSIADNTSATYGQTAISIGLRHKF